MEGLACLSLGEHFKYSIQNVQTLPESTEHNLLGMEAVNIAHSLDILHLQVTEKAYFHLAKAFSTTLCLANAEGLVSYLYSEIKVPKKVLKNLEVIKPRSI